MTEFSRNNVKASKLTPTQVLEIKELYAGGVTQGALCRRFGMSVGQIGRIVRGESWVSVGGQATSPQQALLSEAAFAARLREQASAGEGVAKLAEEFRGMLTGTAVAPLRTPPPSPLDGADTPSETDGSATASLADRARAYNLDIEQLRKLP